MNQIEITKKNKAGQRGFSLVELMVVVAIIGILASLAVPRFRIFQAKARQAEAKTNLSHIYTLQQSYYGDNDAFIAVAASGHIAVGAPNCAATNAIGFVQNPCASARYGYLADIGGGPTTFTATAASQANDDNRVLPGCATVDQWEIDHDKNLTHPSDAILACTN
ncbi:MAG: type IV pilin protein [Oligoflexales bacterium]